MPSNSDIQIPPNIRRLPPAAQAEWLEMEKMKREMAAESTSPNVESVMKRNRAAVRRGMAEKPKRPASPTTAQPPKQRPPTLGGTIKTIEERNKLLQGMKKGGPVKKKAVAKMTPKKKTVAKPAARRGMGKAMRGR
jgi:hypothetical protein